MDHSKNENVNLSNYLYLIGAVLGAIIAFSAAETFLSIIAGLIGGLIFAGVFTRFIIPHKPSDR